MPLVIALSVAGATMATGAFDPAMAQSNRAPSFSLPEPTPTPTPAPAGPADERAGVRIGPRSIDPRDVTPQSSGANTPAPTPTSTRTPSRAPSRASQAAPTPTPTPTRREPQQTRPATSPAPTPTPTPRASVTRPARTIDIGIPRTQSSLPSAASTGASGDRVTSAPGFETDLSAPEDLPTPNADGWYEVAPETPAQSSGSGETRAAPTATPAAEAVDALRRNTWIGLGILALIAAAIGLLFVRRRLADKAEPATGEAALTLGVHRAIKETSGEAVTPSPTTASRATAPVDEPKEEVSAAPARVDLQVEIASATRSLMMVTVDFRLEIANRAEKAVRDVAVLAALSCAERESLANPTDTQEIAQIDRIGPNQNRRVSGQVQMPVSAIRAMRQGSTPMFIPLLNVTLRTADQDEQSSVFVIGLPSAGNQTRVHPIPLDGPPGGLPDLRAQLVKADSSQ